MGLLILAALILVFVGGCAIGTLGQMMRNNMERHG